MCVDRVARPIGELEKREDTSSDVPPLFSVILPVFNRARVVNDSIQSVLRQDYGNFELLVVDDGSTDEIASTLAQYNDPRIRLVWQPNRGASAARNHGIALARGRYVAFLDSDDRYLPNHLSAVRGLLESTEKCIAYSAVRAQRGRTFIVKPPRPIACNETMADYLMCRRGFVQTSGLAVPAEAAKLVRYREDVSFGDDTDFAIRLELAGYKFKMTQTPSVDWFDGPDPGRLSNTPLNSDRLRWLEDLKPRITRKAYRGYKGWHVAKGLYDKHPLAALRLYWAALRTGCYGPRLALVILAQILLPSRIYRDCSDVIIAAGARQHLSVRHGSGA